ncbi:MAG: N-6 DNA methylase, partial [Sciscionella sp.]
MTGTVPDWLAKTVSQFGAACKDKLNGPGEPEDAIRSPLETLLTSIGAELGLTILSHGEAALKELGVRPDYAVRVNGAITGYIEVKKPKLSIDPAGFHGANLKQWNGLKDLPNLLYTNGADWRLYQNGALVAEAALDKDLTKDGSALTVPGPEFERALRGFFQWRPIPITTVARLVMVIAPLCRLLRAAVVEQLIDERKAARADADDPNQLFTALAHDWRNLLFPTADDDTFADGYAQAVTFALLLARTEGIDLAGKGLHEIGRALGPDHSLMGKALQILTDGVSARFETTLDLMVRVVSAVDWPQIRATKADAYLHLYEDFLTVYDEELRKQSGSYYTPREVVAEMVRLTDDVLRTRLGCAQGYLSPNVLTVDPAMGTGTYLHAVIEHAAQQVTDTTGPGALPAAIGELAKKLVGFELQMGPFAVAELRASDLLKRHGAQVPTGGMKLFVTNTLDDPHLEQTQLGAGYEPIAKSRRAANKIKASTPVTVVIGNPPYRERAQDEGGWIEHGALNVTPPLDSFRLDGNGKFEYVLKNLYVYFWRWATWKVFDAHPHDSHGVICFITTSGYLRGPGFKGMRRYLREVCDEGWIINVSPEGMRPDVPTRVFPGVQQPLAIGIFMRKTDTTKTQPAVIHYMEITGRRASKYAQLRDLTLEGDQWRAARTEWESPFTPAALS